MSKPTKEERRKIKAERHEVIALIGGLRGWPVEGSERRALTHKKPFEKGPLFREIVENLADFVEAHVAGVHPQELFATQETESTSTRALWYCCSTFRPPKEEEHHKEKEKKGAPPTRALDPYEEKSAQDIFGFDVRAFRNVRIVTQTLLMYLKETVTPIVPETAYDKFVSGFPFNDPAQQKTRLQTLLKETSAGAFLLIQRVVQMVVNIAGKDEKNVELFARHFGPSVLHPAGQKELTKDAIEVRTIAFTHLCKDPAFFFPNAYVPTKARVGQGIHYNVKHFKQNELEILLEGSQLAKYKSGAVVIEENQPNSSLWLVKSGSFDAFVGHVKVATLIAGDWAGEMSVLSNNISRARVVCASHDGEVHRVDAAKLNAIFAARPDLATVFYSQLAYELAVRLNVALIQFSRATSDRKDISAIPTTGRHVIREVEAPRLRVEDKETHFRYDSDLHAVRAYWCTRVPKKNNKSPREAILYVFGTRLANLYQKGHHQNKTLVDYADLKTIALDGDGAKVRVTYLVSKKEKHFVVQFKSREIAENAVQLVEKLRALSAKEAHKEHKAKPLELAEAVAMFHFAGRDPASQLPLVRGRRYTVLDRVGGWLYGFDPEQPERKGLFPYAYVELRPYGIELEEVLQRADWKALESEFVTRKLAKGETLVREGDPLTSGHLFFLSHGKFSVQKRLENGLMDTLSTLAPGESIGELLFLMGGYPRASVIAEEDGCEVEQLPRERLAKFLADESKAALVAKFWKYLCVMTASRLSFLLLRVKKDAPALPAFVKLEISDAEKNKSQVIEASLLPVAAAAAAAPAAVAAAARPAPPATPAPTGAPPAGAPPSLSTPSDAEIAAAAAAAAAAPSSAPPVAAPPVAPVKDAHPAAAPVVAGAAVAGAAAAASKDDDNKVAPLQAPPDAGVVMLAVAGATETPDKTIAVDIPSGINPEKQAALLAELAKIRSASAADSDESFDSDEEDAKK